MISLFGDTQLTLPSLASPSPSPPPQHWLTYTQTQHNIHNTHLETEDKPYTEYTATTDNNNHNTRETLPLFTVSQEDFSPPIDSLLLMDNTQTQTQTTTGTSSFSSSSSSSSSFASSSGISSPTHDFFVLSSPPPLSLHVKGEPEQLPTTDGVTSSSLQQHSEQDGEDVLYHSSGLPPLLPGSSSSSLSLSAAVASAAQAAEQADEQNAAQAAAGLMDSTVSAAAMLMSIAATNGTTTPSSSSPEGKKHRHHHHHKDHKEHREHKDHHRHSSSKDKDRSRDKEHKGENEQKEHKESGSSLKSYPSSVASMLTLAAASAQQQAKPRQAAPLSALDRFCQYLLPRLQSHANSPCTSMTLEQLKHLGKTNFFQLIHLSVKVHFNPRLPLGPDHNDGKEEKLIICRSGWNALRNFISTEREKIWKAEMAGMSVREQRMYKKRRREEKSVANAAIREGRMAKFIDIANEYGINYANLVKLGDEHSGRLRYRKNPVQAPDPNAAATSPGSSSTSSFPMVPLAPIAPDMNAMTSPRLMSLLNATNIPSLPSSSPVQPLQPPTGMDSYSLNPAASGPPVNTLTPTSSLLSPSQADINHVYFNSFPTLPGFNNYSLHPAFASPVTHLPPNAIIPPTTSATAVPRPMPIPTSPPPSVPVTPVSGAASTSTTPNSVTNTPGRLQIIGIESMLPGGGSSNGGGEHNTMTDLMMTPPTSVAVPMAVPPAASSFSSIPSSSAVASSSYSLSSSFSSPSSSSSSSSPSSSSAGDFTVTVRWSDLADKSTATEELKGEEENEPKRRKLSTQANTNTGAAAAPPYPPSTVFSQPPPLPQLPPQLTGAAAASAAVDHLLHSVVDPSKMVHQHQQQQQGVNGVSAVDTTKWQQSHSPTTSHSPDHAHANTANAYQQTVTPSSVNHSQSNNTVVPHQPWSNHTHNPLKLES